MIAHRVLAQVIVADREARHDPPHNWQPIETRWGGAYHCPRCHQTTGDPDDGPCIEL